MCGQPGQERFHGKRPRIRKLENGKLNVCRIVGTVCRVQSFPEPSRLTAVPLEQPADQPQLLWQVTADKVSVAKGLKQAGAGGSLQSQPWPCRYRPATHSAGAEGEDLAERLC